MNKITPSQLSSLDSNEIFVFGSNLEGNHAGGAAKFAVIKFGAEMGNGVGIQGNSYAIPTLSKPAFNREELEQLKLPINVIGKYVDMFINFAISHPELFFYVTPIGCGIAGFTENEIAPLFKKALGVENIALPETFLSIIGQQNNLQEMSKKRNMNKNRIRITESQLHRVIKESVRKVLRESEGFTPSGYRTVSNLGGHEIEISPNGDAARFRFYGGEPTDWLEIEFDDNGVAYVETERGKERLCDYMRY